jgi:hypothetical protein
MSDATLYLFAARVHCFLAIEDFLMLLVSVSGVAAGGGGGGVMDSVTSPNLGVARPISQKRGILRENPITRPGFSQH